MLIAEQSGFGMPAVYRNCLRKPAALTLWEIWPLRL